MSALYLSWSLFKTTPDLVILEMLEAELKQTATASTTGQTEH